MRRFNCSLENRSNPSCKIYEIFEFSYLFPVHWNTIFYLQYVMTIIVNHLRFSFSQMGNENNWLSKYNVVGSRFLSIENSHKFQQTVDKRPMITRLILLSGKRETHSSSCFETFFLFSCSFRDIMHRICVFTDLLPKTFYSKRDQRIRCLRVIVFITEYRGPIKSSSY